MTRHGCNGTCHESTVLRERLLDYNETIVHLRAEVARLKALLASQPPTPPRVECVRGASRG